MEIKITNSNGNYAVIQAQTGASLIELNLAGLSLIDLPGSKNHPLESNPYHPSAL